MITIGSLFSGIGGLELGLERAGLGPVLWQVEIDPFCRDKLARHWPNVKRFEDVTTIQGTALPPVDLICGGFPCQDVSSVGKGAGLAGSRSGLWFEFARIVSELRPSWVVVENVASGAKRWVDAAVAWLEQLDYETLPFPVSAQDVGAPHLRKRIFVVGYSHGQRQPTEPVDAEMARVQGMAGSTNAVGHNSRPRTNKKSRGGQTRQISEGRDWSTTLPPICRVDDGIPDRVDRIRALGNAVVPQCAEVIGHVINELEAACTI